MYFSTIKKKKGYNTMKIISKKELIQLLTRLEMQDITKNIKINQSILLRYGQSKIKLQVVKRKNNNYYYQLLKF